MSLSRTALSQSHESDRGTAFVSLTRGQTWSQTVIRCRTTQTWSQDVAVAGPLISNRIQPHDLRPDARIAATAAISKAPEDKPEDRMSLPRDRCFPTAQAQT